MTESASITTEEWQERWDHMNQLAGLISTRWPLSDYHPTDSLSLLFFLLSDPQARSLLDTLT